MQLVQIENMIKLNSESFCSGDIDKPYSIEATALSIGSGYILEIKLDSVKFMVSSQREDKRVFKSIDSLIKLLKTAGIQSVKVFN